MWCKSFLIAMASLTVELWTPDPWALVVAEHKFNSAHGLSCPMACGILLDQELNHFPVLAGGFLSTIPPGKSYNLFLNGNLL